jgi:hypothetical protein
LKKRPTGSSECEFSQTIGDLVHIIEAYRDIVRLFAANLTPHPQNTSDGARIWGVGLDVTVA